MMHFNRPVKNFPVPSASYWHAESWMRMVTFETMKTTLHMVLDDTGVNVCSSDLVQHVLHLVRYLLTQESIGGGVIHKRVHVDNERLLASSM